MTTELFAKLLSSSESSVLDFKKEQYKLISDTTGNETAKFVKDIICFCNTVREGPSYIIIGVDVSIIGTNLTGLDIYIDEAIFQDKIKDKVSPKPVFKYYSFEYESQRFGIFEFPIYKYPEPISPIIKMKGLEIGKVYFRRGSTNSECNGRETIHVSDWLRSLKNPVNLSDKVAKVTILLSKINHNIQPLSSSISECLGIAKEFDDIDLIKFCKAELQGWYKVDVSSEDLIQHRKAKVIVSMFKITDVESSGGYNVRHMWEDLKYRENFKEISMAFPEPIGVIENTMDEYRGKGLDSFATLEARAKDIFPDGNFGDMPIFIYSKFDNFKDIYNNTRQKVIDELIKRTEEN